jgi:hypothetical protein
MTLADFEPMALRLSDSLGQGGGDWHVLVKIAFEVVEQRTLEEQKWCDFCPHF